MAVTATPVLELVREISISSSLSEFLEGLFLEFGLLLVGPTVAGSGTAV